VVITTQQYILGLIVSIDSRPHFILLLEESADATSKSALRWDGADGDTSL
jgi:hypothetical protein